ncbi:hypothetical protein [Alkaliphilus serpentinus]|uniref:Uncharacterized protein n=1 Tax=Alkaliphilus serpentinus TaxID=1482731 RepID=A0A833M7P0_9FIRM|nr:hypothetical protein [Alkaliphilus serpentinus]KAB3531073.1 hypothetical protein F8153_05405 [Alkaliphilus serpentinus]
MSGINENRNTEKNNLKKLALVGVKPLSITVLVLSFSVYSLGIPKTQAYFVQEIKNIRAAIFNITDSTEIISGSINFQDHNAQLTEFNVFSSHVEEVQRERVVGYLLLPDGFNIKDINLDTLQLKLDSNDIKINSVDYIGGQLVVVLDKDYLLNTLGHGNYPITLEGLFNNGYYQLNATGTLEVIDEEYLKLLARLEDLTEGIIEGFNKAENFQGIGLEELEELEAKIMEYNSLSEAANEEWLEMIEEIKERYNTYLENLKTAEMINAAYEALDTAMVARTDEAINDAMALITALPEGKEKEQLANAINILIQEIAVEGEAPIEGEEPPEEGEEPPEEGEEPPVEGEEPPEEGEEPPVEGEEPPVEGEEPSVESEEPSVEGEEPSVEGEEPPVEGEEPTEGEDPADGEYPPVEGEDPVDGQDPLADGEGENTNPVIKDEEENSLEDGEVTGGDDTN